MYVSCKIILVLVGINLLFKKLYFFLLFVYYLYFCIWFLSMVGMFFFNMVFIVEGIDFVFRWKVVFNIIGILISLKNW